MVSGKGTRRKRVTAPTQDMMLAGIRQCAEQLGYAPSATDYRLSRIPPGRDAIVDHFGSWINAMRAAGLGPKRRSVSPNAPVASDEVIRALGDLAATLGRTPGRRDWQARGLRPCTDYIAKMFGSWQAAIDAAGLPPTRTPRQPRERSDATRTMVTGGRSRMAAWTEYHEPPTWR